MWPCLRCAYWPRYENECSRNRQPPKREDVIIEILTDKNALAWIRIPVAWLAESWLTQAAAGAGALASLSGLAFDQPTLPLAPPGVKSLWFRYLKLQTKPKIKRYATVVLFPNLLFSCFIWLDGCVQRDQISYSSFLPPTTTTTAHRPVLGCRAAVIVKEGRFSGVNCTGATRPISDLKQVKQHASTSSSSSSSSSSSRKEPPALTPIFSPIPTFTTFFSIKLPLTSL